MLIGLLPLIAAGVYFHWWHRKAVAENDRLAARQEELQTRNDAARPRSSPQTIKNLQRKLALYEEHARQLERLIPLREQVPELLYSVTERAQEAGVDHALIKPDGEKPGEFYTQQTYSMRVSGTYHAIGQFLAEIGSLPRIITPTQLVVTMPPGSAKHRAPGSPLRLQADFKIQTYIIPAPASAGTTPRRDPNAG
jgi:type IV pilus assembly protein PilO